ncbi:beta-lactamase family protein [Streptomyces sp. NBC_00513]|uniref:serine hydrolase domain-containing protein n=1 Tax=unclassified Streptomyces TaxID=2593676 RepID=UPI0022537C79|nr:serine hydrolase domain-containing protein [Streptomyces sp. NBC_00424]MCX5077540.1 beta-lactamase family protein [Streptomyces sp. NBC_00424]WUD39484.1 beta-lactamase family protein [Streptomyces sp. NBC_00513]
MPAAVRVQQSSGDWESVISRFQELVDTQREPGGSLAIWRDGAPALVVHGGSADVAREVPWSADTLVQVFSTGKPLVALAALQAVADGHLGLDEPVTARWPAYRDAPAHPTTLRMILSHRSGKHTFSPAAAGLDPRDHAALVHDLEAMEPRTVPGQVIAEHASTYGHLVDGLLAAVGAPSVRAHTEALSGVLGARLRFGVHPHELPLVAEPEPMGTEWTDSHLAHELGRAALLRPAGLLDADTLRSPSWHQARFGAVGLITDATSLASLYDDLGRPDGHVARLLGGELWSELFRTAATGTDGFLRDTVRWSLGFQIDDNGDLGMGGIGGSCAWYSPAHGYALAYVTRGLHTHDRVTHLADAVESTLRADHGAPALQERTEG